MAFNCLTIKINYWLPIKILQLSQHSNNIWCCNQRNYNYDFQVLQSVQDRNETLFYRLLMDNFIEVCSTFIFLSYLVISRCLDKPARLIIRLLFWFPSYRCQLICLSSFQPVWSIHMQQLNSSNQSMSTNKSSSHPPRWLRSSTLPLSAGLAVTFLIFTGSKSSNFKNTTPSRRPRGMYFCRKDRGEMASMVYNWESDQVLVVVVGYCWLPRLMLWWWLMGAGCWDLVTLALGGLALA